MLIIDANAILRYILCDNTDMANKVNELISRNVVTIRDEVMAEVIYVLEKLYSMPRDEIVSGIKLFLAQPNVSTESKDVLLLALETFSKMRLDFVDCLLYGFKTVCGYNIFTFDKSLNSLINR